MVGGFLLLAINFPGLEDYAVMAEMVCAGFGLI